MEFRILGPLQAISDEGTAVPVNRAQRRLLGILLASANSPVSAHHLIDLLWPDGPPPSASNSLHAHISRLRHRLGLEPDRGMPPALETTAAGYCLHVETAHLDAARFEAMASQASGYVVEDPASAVEALATALELWHGPAFAEFAGEPFALAEATRLDELRLMSIEHLCDARLRLGRHLEVVAELERLILQHPLRERAYGLLILALYRGSRQADALETFRLLRTRLADELGLEPSVEVQRLEEKILRQDPSLDWHGEGGVKHAVRGTLHTSLSSFVGRTRDVAAIIDQLRQVRLLTLTGAGGVGKTRLAAAVATSMSQEYDDGTWLCELAPIREAAAVEESLLTALGIKQQQAATIMESLLNVLRGRRLLLILDNCEHVIDTVSHLAQAIISNCPAVTVLATSRQPLNIEGEQRWPVEPLSLAAPDGAATPDGAAGHNPATATGPSAAVQLFCDRAASADPAFDGSSAEAIAEICERLDGVPLAIELAAARVPALGPDELRRRLDDRFRLLTAGPRTDPRHRSLSAVVDWSYDLLSQEEQIVFSRLSVFAGSFTLEAAEQVCCSGSIERGGFAALVAGLVDASMLVRDRTGSGGDRLRLLETLRQYAAERLAAHGDTELQRHRFAEYYASLAETAEPQIRGRDEAAWVLHLDNELDNLRAAHQLAISADDVDLALRLPAALHYYAFFRLRDEVHGWAEASLALAGDRWHRLLAQVQGAAAERAGHHGDLHRAVELAGHGLIAARDPLSKIRPLETLAVVALYQGRLDDCFGYARETLEVTIPAHEHYNTAFAYLHQVLSCLYGGDRAAARRLMSKVEEAAELCGSPTHLAWTAYCWGELLSAEDADAALARFEDAVAIAQTVRNSFTAGVARVSIGTLRSRHGNTGDALRSFHEVIGHWYRVNDWVHQWTTLRNLIDLFARLEANLDAAVLYGAVVHPRTGATAFGADQERMSAMASSLKEAIGDAGFEAAVARGAKLSDDQAVGYALQGIERALER